MFVSYLARFSDFTLVAWLVVGKTDEPFIVVLLGFFRFLPFLITGPFTGLVIDRLPRLLVVRVIGASSTIFTLTIAVLLFLDLVVLWHIFLYTTLIGFTWSVETPARRVYMRGIVGSLGITRVLAIEMIAWFGGQLIGSNVAGLGLMFIHPGWLFLLVASLMIGSIFLLGGLPTGFTRSLDKGVGSFGKSLAEGFQLVKSSRLLKGSLLIMGVTNLFAFNFEPLTPVFAVHVMGLGSALLGLLISAPAIGAMAGAVWLSLYGHRVHRHGILLTAATMGMMLGNLGLSISNSFIQSLLSLMLVGASLNLFITMSGALILVSVPIDKQGRVLGIQAVMIGFFPVGTLIVGSLSNQLGPNMALLITSLVGCVTTASIALLFSELRLPTRVLNGKKADDQ